MEAVRRLLSETKIGAPQVNANLAMYPLWAGAREERPYWMLDEALASGKVRITEVSQGGSVPELAVANDGDRAVLLLDGEELLGAKQNRVINITILVAAGATVVVPVSCVEAGRWRHVSADFRSSEQVLYARSRAAMSRDVAFSLASSGAPTSNQRRIWNSIADKMQALGVRSDTGAMSEAYASKRPDLEGYLRAFRLEPGQTGVAFALDARVAGVEYSDHPDALARVFPKLVRSWALDAIEGPRDVAPPSVDAVRIFLDEARSTEMKSYPGIGRGADVRLSSRWISGGALVDGDRVVHLSAFSR